MPWDKLSKPISVLRRASATSFKEKRVHALISLAFGLGKSKAKIMKKNRRLIHVWAGIPLKEEDMGEVRVKVKLTNNRDELMAREGLLKPEQVRSLEVEALVDTGAVRCVIPAKIKQELGLGTVARRRAQYADGRSEEVDVTEPVRIDLENRPTYEDCLVLGDQVLIGQTALESTDLFVDCVGGRLVPNPAHPHAVVLGVI
jgi:clan AA aspartic protease